MAASTHLAIGGPPRIHAVVAHGGWRRYRPDLGALMKAQLERIVAVDGLSKNVFELASKALA